MRVKVVGPNARGRILRPVMKLRLAPGMKSVARICKREPLVILFSLAVLFFGGLACLLSS